MSVSDPTTRQRDGLPKPASSAKAMHYPFWFGGSAASMAACVTHPLDLVKVRLQTRAPTDPKSMLGTFVHIFRAQGLPGLYSGLTAALLRQLTYSTVRFGVYEDLKVRFAPPDPKQRQPLLNLILMSSAAGFAGGVIGNPGDILNVRMQSDAGLPSEQQRQYKWVGNGLVRMVREEGPASLFRGVAPNAVRASLMTASQLASYDTFKNMCIDTLHLPDNTGTHFLASFAAGFVATSICSPVDVIKTRIMSAEGKSSIMDLLHRAYATEGVFWIFRGWVPSFVRLGPQTIATMLFFEQHKTLYRKWKGVEEPVRAAM